MIAAVDAVELRGYDVKSTRIGEGLEYNDAYTSASVIFCTKKVATWSQGIVNADARIMKPRVISNLEIGPADFPPELLPCAATRTRWPRSTTTFCSQSRGSSLTTLLLVSCTLTLLDSFGFGNGGMSISSSFLSW